MLSNTYLESVCSRFAEALLEEKIGVPENLSHSIRGSVSTVPLVFEVEDGYLVIKALGSVIHWHRLPQYPMTPEKEQAFLERTILSVVDRFGSMLWDEMNIDLCEKDRQEILEAIFEDHSDCMGSGFLGFVHEWGVRQLVCTRCNKPIAAYDRKSDSSVAIYHKEPWGGGMAMNVFVQTDADQYVKRTADRTYQVVEINSVPEEHFFVCSMVIDLHGYSDEDLEGYASLGYGSLQELRSIYGVASDQILAELISETDGMSEGRPLQFDSPDAVRAYLFETYGFEWSAE